MTCMTGFVDSVISSTDGWLTLRCPSSSISLVDTSFSAFLYSSYRNVNIGTERNTASTQGVTEFPFSREALQSVISSVLRRVYAKDRHAPKRISNEVDVEPRTARAYLDGDRIPGGYAFFQLMARCRELRDEINRHAAEVEAAYKAADQGNKKTNDPVRSDNAEFWLRGHAKTRVGCHHAWRHESVALRPSIFLVDDWPGVRRAGGERTDAPACERSPEEGDADSRPGQA
jgi:hypothetical protein